MLRSKNRRILILALVLLAVMTAGATLAYFTDQHEAVNTFTVGNLKINLTEEWNPEDGEDMTPGDTVIKEPIVTALSGDSYMRLLMTFIDSDTNQKIPYGSARWNKIYATLVYDPNKTHVIPGDKYAESDITGMISGGMIARYNTSLYFQGAVVADTVHYYYKNVSAVSPRSQNIFYEGDVAPFITNVVIPNDWDEADIAILGEYKITFKAEAIQSSGFVGYTDAFIALDAAV